MCLSPLIVCLTLCFNLRQPYCFSSVLPAKIFHYKIQFLMKSSHCFVSIWNTSIVYKNNVFAIFLRSPECLFWFGFSIWFIRFVLLHIHIIITRFSPTLSEFCAVSVCRILNLHESIFIISPSSLFVPFYCQ